MAGPLRNEKHERFCRALVGGATLAKAYVQAGYAPNEKNAARLKKNEGVAARIAELQAKVADKVTTTAADIARQLDEDRKFARQLKQSAAAVTATMGKAKVLGLIVEKTRVSFDFSNLNDEDLDALERILGKTTNA
jgi:phage terminase small subunit